MSLTRFKHKSSILSALTTSAIALPGYALAEDVDTRYRYSNYNEDSVNGQERYDIKTHQLSLSTDVKDDITLSASLLHETMSGASPWYIIQDVNENPQLVMSGATISETRDDLRVSASIPHEKSETSVSLGLSEENDYSALFLSAEEQIYFNSKNTTLLFSLGYSDDELTPTDSGIFPERPVKESKDTTKLAVGVSQIVDKYSVFNISLGYTRHAGFLSDPYKLVEVNQNVEAENRPDGRTQWALSARYRHHFLNHNTLHLDYRLYDDDWDVRSHTLDASYYFNLVNQWQVVPGVRYYNQSSAFFYSPFYFSARGDGYQSSDYRLSPYGAISYRIKVNKWIAGWQFTASLERYDSSGSYALKEVLIENPGLVDFTIFSLGFYKIF